MKLNEYNLMNNLSKQKLIEEDFVIISENVCKYHRFLYKKDISLNLLIYLTEKENIKLHIDIIDENLSQLYAAVYNNYGKNKVRNKVINNYNQTMNKLVEKGILETY